MSHRIFVTGATGYLGGAIAARLARAGHTVLGLVRDPARAASLEARGVTPVPGDLTEPRSFLGLLKNCDAVVQAATDSRAAAALDHGVLDAVRTGAEDGRVRRLLYTSGMWVHGDSGGAVVDEDSPLAPLPIARWRESHEEMALELSSLEVATIVLRPTIVYGGAGGIVGGMFAEARDQKSVTVPGDGSQHWGMAHLDDVADAYALALEHGKGGDRFVLNDGSALTAGAIGQAIAKVTGAELRTWPHEQVLAALGPYGEALLASQRSSAARARRELGWVPRHTSFVDGIEGVYKEWMEATGSSVR